MNANTVKILLKCPSCFYLSHEKSSFCGYCGFNLSSVESFQNVILQHKNQVEQFKIQKENYQKEIQELVEKYAQTKQDLAILNEEANLYSFGFYQPRYNFSSSGMYLTRLERSRNSQKNMVKQKTAVQCFNTWSINGSVVEGRKQTNQILKMMLRAFNGETDAAIAKVKYNNVNVMEARILKSFETLNSLATVQGCFINNDYLNLKLEELFLVHEYQEKLYLEKEEQREIRERMREEEKAQREFEKARLEAEKEERRYSLALEKARLEILGTDGKKQETLKETIRLLENKLLEAQANKERAISRAQQTKSGHIYIISNKGSFGENIFKIGMTRRLDPMERIIELGGASVPFRFSVHAIIYSEDAPALENKLHKMFEKNRVNFINNRKEFFKVELSRLIQTLRDICGEVDFTESPESPEFEKTLEVLKIMNSIS